jgi:hypothetical protein
LKAQSKSPEGNPNAGKRSFGMTDANLQATCEKYMKHCIYMYINGGSVVEQLRRPAQSFDAAVLAVLLSEWGQSTRLDNLP